MIRPQAFRFAWLGVLRTFREEPNFRIHLIVGEAVLYVALAERQGPAVWAMLILTIGLVLALELVNTAVERALDLAADGRELPLAAAAKDAAAGAVLAGSVAAAAVGAVLLWDRLFMLLAVLSHPLDYVGLAALAVLALLTYRAPRARR
jgi:diacylglycerol kinase